MSKQLRKKLETTEMCFLQISWTEKKSNETVLGEDVTRSFINVCRIHKYQDTFLGHEMNREELEHLVTTGMMEGKRSRGNRREKMDELT